MLKVGEGYNAEKVKDGVFQAMMEVALINDGPVSRVDQTRALLTKYRLPWKCLSSLRSLEAKSELPCYGKKQGSYLFVPAAWAGVTAFVLHIDIGLSSDQ